MKRFLTSLLLIVLAVGSIWAKTYVVAAGVSNYHDEKNALDYPAQDATQFAKTMKAADCTVTLLTSKNAKHDNIIAAIRRIGKIANDKDRIVLFFCGHGGDGFVLTYDDPEIKNKYLTYEELIRELNAVKAGQKVVFINACHSGSAAAMAQAPAWEDGARDSKIALYMSSEAGENSIESNWTSAGFFSRSVLNCLHGLCDTNGDRKITYKEMGDYIRQDVSKRSNDKQHPVAFYGGGMENAVFMKW